MRHSGNSRRVAGPADNTNLSGNIVQIVNVQDGAVATGTTVIPFDDTIPQNTEGDQVMSLAITPTSATNILHIDVVCNMSCPSTDHSTAVLFQDSTADGLAAAHQRPATAQRMANVTFRHRMTAGTTSSTTFKVRASGNDAGTYTFNGGVSSGVRLYGGVVASSITITEIQV